MIYLYDPAKWSKGSAWDHLWNKYLSSKQYIPHTNPFRKAHMYGDEWGEVDWWAWRGPELTPTGMSGGRNPCGPSSFALVRCNPCPHFQACWDASQAGKL